MVTEAYFTKLAVGFDDVSVQPHFNKASFRTNGKIFATLDSVQNRASLKLSAVDQSVYGLVKPAICIPAAGAWGRQGWTVFDLAIVPGDILAEALQKAYTHVAKPVKLQ